MRKAVVSALFAALLLAAAAAARPVGAARALAGGGQVVVDIAQTEQLMAAFTDTLNTSADRSSLLAALGMLKDAAWTPALPAARRLAVMSDDVDVRRAAVELLGWHGEARDWELIILGLYSGDEADVLAAVRAVEQYGDERGLDYLDDLAAHAGTVVAVAAAESRGRLQEFLEQLAGPSAKDLGVSDIPRLRSMMVSAKASGGDDAGAQAEAIATVMRLVLHRAAAEGDP